MDYTEVDENDLHALVDGQLPPARRCRVELHLAACPDLAACVRDLLGQREALAVLAEALASAGLGPVLPPSAEALARTVRRQRRVRRAVAVSGMVGLAVIGRAVVAAASRSSVRPAPIPSH